MYILIGIYVTCWALLPCTFVWAIGRWWKSVPRFEAPRWRSQLALSAFSFGGLSLLLWCVLALLGRGFRPYDPALLQCFRIGILLGLVGFVIGLPAKGK